MKFLKSLYLLKISVDLFELRPVDNRHITPFPPRTWYGVYPLGQEGRR